MNLLSRYAIAAVVVVLDQITKMAAGNVGFLLASVLLLAFV